MSNAPHAPGWPQQRPHPSYAAHPPGQQQPSAGQPYATQPHPAQPYGIPYAPHPAPAWVPPVPVYPYAPWIRRVGAFLIDFAPAYVAQVPFLIGYLMVYVRLLQLSTTGAGGSEQLIADLTGTPLVLMAVGFVLMLAALGWQWYNRWLIGGRTGQSLGKRVLRTKLVAEVNGQPIGAVNAFLRDLLHVLDGVAYVGYLWPLWDVKRQTFSDMIMKTVVTDLRVTTAPAPSTHPQPWSAA